MIIIYYIYFGRIRARTLASLLLPSGSRSVFIPTIKRRKQKAIIIFTLLATHERLAPMASHSQFALTMSIRMDAIGSPSGEEAKKKTESAASEETSHNPIGYTRRPVHLAVGYLGRERVFLQVNTRRYSSSSSWWISTSSQKTIIISGTFMRFSRYGSHSHCPFALAGTSNWIQLHFIHGESGDGLTSARQIDLFRWKVHFMICQSVKANHISASIESIATTTFHRFDALSFEIVCKAVKHSDRHRIREPNENELWAKMENIETTFRSRIAIGQHRRSCIIRWCNTRLRLMARKWEIVFL